MVIRFPSGFAFLSTTIRVRCTAPFPKFRIKFNPSDSNRRRGRAIALRFDAIRNAGCRLGGASASYRTLGDNASSRDLRHPKFGRLRDEVANLRDNGSTPSERAKASD